MLKTLVSRFLTAKTAAGLSPRTLNWYSEQITVYLHWLAAQEPSRREAWSAENVERFLSEQRTVGLSPATVSARYRALRVWFGWLERRNLIAANPIADIDRPRLPVKRMHHVTQVEFQQLYESAQGQTWPDYRDRALLLLLYWSGLRVGELIALTPHTLDTQRRIVYVRGGKGAKDRLVPCHPDVAAIVTGYLFTRPEWAGPELWLSNDGYGGARGPLTAEGVRQMLRRRCKALKIRHLNPHAFRHGYAMTMLNAGMAMSAVADTMGHYSVRVTEQTYARWLPASLQREYDDALRRAEGG